MSIPYYRYVEYVEDGISDYQCLNCYNHNIGYVPNWKYCPFCGIEIKGLKECRPHDEPKHPSNQIKLSQKVLIIYKEYPSLFSDRKHVEQIQAIGMNLGFSLYVKKMLDYYKKEIQKELNFEDDEEMRKNLLETKFFFRIIERNIANTYVNDHWDKK